MNVVVVFVVAVGWRKVFGVRAGGDGMDGWKEVKGTGNAMFGPLG